MTQSTCDPLARLPPELGFYVLWLAGATASLRVAMTCCAYYTRITADRLLWQRLYWLTFTDEHSGADNDTESDWLRWYLGRPSASVAALATQASEFLPFDWYRVFTARCTTNQRWRVDSSTAETLVDAGPVQWHCELTCPWLSVWRPQQWTLASALKVIRHARAQPSTVHWLPIAGPPVRVLHTSTHLVAFVRLPGMKEQHVYTWCLADIGRPANGTWPTEAHTYPPQLCVPAEWSPSTNALGPWLLTLAGNTTTGAPHPTLLHMDGHTRLTLHMPGAYVSRHLQYVQSTSTDSTLPGSVGLFLYSLNIREISWQWQAVSTVEALSTQPPQVQLIHSDSIKLDGRAKPPLRMRSRRLDDAHALLHGADMRGPAEFIGVVQFQWQQQRTRLLWHRLVAYEQVVPLNRRLLLLASLPPEQRTVPGVDRTSLVTAMNRLRSPPARPRLSATSTAANGVEARITVHVLSLMDGTLLQECRWAPWSLLQPVLGTLAVLSRASDGRRWLVDAASGAAIRELPGQHGNWMVDAVHYHYQDADCVKSLQY